MDKEQGREKDQREASPPVEGVRRSRRLQNFPSRNPIGGGEGSGESGGSTGSDRKRKKEVRRQGQEEGEDIPQKEGGSVPAGDDGVNVQVSSKKVKVDPAGGDENGMVGGAIKELDKVAVSSPGGMTTRGAAARRFTEVSRSLEDFREEQEEAHPCLFIENVLDVIFKHLINQPGPRTLIANDVQNIRLVCRTWKTSITRLYRQTRPETILDSYGQWHESCYPVGRLNSALTSFMRTMSSSQMIPVQKYSFCGGAFHRKNLKMFREFLLLCGPEVVELSISTMSSDAERIMVNLENFPALEMKKLKDLKLSKGMHLGQQQEPPPDKLEENDFVKLLEFLLIAAKNLEEVTLDYQSHTCCKLHRSPRDLVVEQLCLVIAQRMSRTVRKLELKMELSEAAVINLAEMQASLESLTVRVPPPGLEGSRSTHKFLQSRAASLAELQIRSSYNAGNRYVIEIPRLDELVNLILFAEIGVSGPSHFTDTFPKLRRLQMRTKDVVSTLLSTVKKPSGSLKVLDLGDHGLTCPAHLVKNVGQSFPFLVELHMGVNVKYKETLVEVFKYLDSLESLYVSLFAYNQFDNWVDSLSSGIPKPECNRIKRLPDFGTVNVSELQRQPSILNLTNLRKLVVEEIPGSRRIAFTDVSAHFAFLEMENLHEIKIPTTAAQFSPRYLELLGDKLVLVDEPLLT